MPIVKTKSGRFKIRNVPGSDTKKEKMKQLRAIKSSENFAEDPSKRQHTILQYERSGASELAQLLRDLDSNDSDVRADAVDGLADLGDARAVPMLFRMLKDEDFYVRNNTVQALQEFGDKRAVEPLIEALNDEKADIRLYAVRALAELEDKKAIEPLLALLKKEDARHSEDTYGRSFTGAARNPVGQEIEAALSSLGYDTPDTFAEIPKDPIVQRKEALDKERSARTPGVDLSYEIIKTHKTSQEEADFEKMLYDLERQFGSYSPPDQVILLNALEEKRQTQDAWDNEIQDFFRALVERDFATHEELTDVVGEEWVIKNFPESDIAKEREKEEQDLEDYEDSMRHWGLMSESEFAEMTPELAEKVRIEHEVSWEDEEDIGGYIDALVEEETDPEGRIGFVNYVYDKETNSLNIQAVEVPRAWRRQGVATAMYDKLMQEYPGANMPAGVQTSKGKSFRKAYNKRVGIRPDGTLVVRKFSEKARSARNKKSNFSEFSDEMVEDLYSSIDNKEDFLIKLEDNFPGLFQYRKDYWRAFEDHIRGENPDKLKEEDFLDLAETEIEYNLGLTELLPILSGSVEFPFISFSSFERIMRDSESLEPEKTSSIINKAQQYLVDWYLEEFPGIKLPRPKEVVFSEEPRERLEQKAKLGDPTAKNKLKLLSRRTGEQDRIKQKYLSLGRAVFDALDSWVKTGNLSEDWIKAKKAIAEYHLDDESAPVRVSLSLSDPDLGYGSYKDFADAVEKKASQETFAERDREQLERDARLGDPIAKTELERLKPREDKDYVARLNDNSKDLSALTYLMTEDSQSGGNLKALMHKIVELDDEIEKLDEESEEEEFSDTAREIASLYHSQLKVKRQAEKILKGYGVSRPKEVISVYRLAQGQ